MRLRAGDATDGRSPPGMRGFDSRALRKHTSLKAGVFARATYGATYAPTDGMAARGDGWYRLPVTPLAAGDLDGSPFNRRAREPVFVSVRVGDALARRGMRLTGARDGGTFGRAARDRRNGIVLGRAGGRPRIGATKAS
jgi:hypothetical protein